jgi:hypothetical protein
MSVVLCRFCRKVYVEWAWTRYGKRLPFAYDLVDIDELARPEDGWVPGSWTVGRQVRLAMAPLTHYGQERQRTARRVAVLHDCPQYREARAQGSTHAPKIPDEKVVA